MTREYLRLALEYPEYFKHILAVTFTNKATEEMKSRILETLHKFSTQSHPLKFEIGKALNLSNDEITSRSKKVLRSILHNYSAFSVSTIDSFFQKVVRTFAREIGVQGGFKVELDQKKVISEVVDQLLLEVGQNEKLTDWLTQYALYNISEGKKWDSKKDIKNLSDELFKELFLFKKDTIFEKVKDDRSMISFVECLTTIKKKFESHLRMIGTRGLQIISDHGLSINDFSQKQRGAAGYFQKLSKGAFTDPNSYVQAALNEGQWYSKKSTKIEQIESALSAGLSDALEEAVNYYQDNYTEYFTSISVIGNIYTLGILSEVLKYLDVYRDSNDTLLISDFPVFLSQIIGDSDAPYIYEKIGAKYRNFLIDEFQDTSGLQWTNFKPLIKNSLASNNFNMIVGDIKQSIYRWRGGNWRLLLEQVQHELGNEDIEVRQLNINWRSRKNIIDFNNRLFKEAPDLIYEHLARDIPPIAQVGLDNIKDAYGDSFQQIADKDNSEGGMVSVNFIETIDRSEFDQLSLDLMIKRIKQLQDANYNLKDIAILVRTAKEGRKVTEALNLYERTNAKSKYRYDVISSESLYLKNSSLVNFIINTLYFILDENESLHKAQFSYAYERLFEPINQDKLNLVESDMKSNIASLRSMPLVDLIEEVVRIFELRFIKGQLPYLLSFQDTILDYSKDKTSSIDGFLSWWKENPGRSIQVSENQNAIRLMTIHKSKGLQFKTVIIPFCTWSLDHGGGGLRQNTIWCDTDKIDTFSFIPFLPLKYKSDMSKTYFVRDYWKEKVKAYMDNLNLLYVACTRAEEALYIMALMPKSKSMLSSASDLLYQSLDGKMLNELSKKEQNPIELKFGEMVKFSVYDEDEELNQVSINDYISKPWRQRSELQTKKHRFWFDENVQAKIDQGKIVHWILSKVRYESDLSEVMRMSANEFDLNEKQAEIINLRLKNNLVNNQIKEWFSQKWNVKNEMNILEPGGNVLRPDRVIVKENTAVVIDYKTGLESPDHYKQVKSYALLLEDMGYELVKGYLLYVNEFKVKEVV